MSQFALLLVTDEQTIDAACRGWAPPLEAPIKKSLRNPFTNEPMDVVSYIPEEFEGDPGAATPYEVHDELKTAQPVAIDFKVFGDIAAQLAEAAPYRLTRDDEGFILSVQRIRPENEDKILAHFRDQLGQYADAAARRAQKLSTFVFVYDV